MRLAVQDMQRSGLGLKPKPGLARMRTSISSPGAVCGSAAGAATEAAVGVLLQAHQQLQSAILSQRGDGVVAAGQRRA
jgi:hypothetical protein